MPEGTGELYHKFEARTTDVPFGNTIAMAYEAVNLFVLGIQRADSFDPDAVKAVLDDPDLRFDWFGFKNSKLGGIEYYGRPCVFPIPLGISVVEA